MTNKGGRPVRETDVATMLNLFQLAGHYSSQHGPFHDLRDSLLRDQVFGPNGEPLPLPPVGNWILALGVSLLGRDTPAGHELFSRVTNHQTAGDLVEAWALQLWQRDYRSLCEQLSGFFLLLHDILADVPARLYSALGQEWRITWCEFRDIMRAWIGDPPAPTMLAITQEPETEAGQSRFGRLSETLRARSLSPSDGPLLGSRTDLIDGATDARVFPTILLPYTFPAFQVGLALPLPLQDQSECAYMIAWSSMHAALLPVTILLFSLLSCLHRCLAHFLSRCLRWGTQCPDLWTSHTGAQSSDPGKSLIRSCFSPFRILCKQLLFMLCTGCLIQTGTSTKTGVAKEATVTVVGSEPVSSRMPALQTAGYQSVATAGPASLPRKRALRRAIGRAARNPDQSTHYKGRLCTLDTLREVPANSGARPAPRSRVGVTDSKHGPRIRAMSWNVGGLSQEAWLEVQIWMHQQTEHDVILLQETHWRFTSSWSIPRYHIFHSGATDHRFQGCMIAIHKSITSFESVRFPEHALQGGYLTPFRLGMFRIWHRSRWLRSAPLRSPRGRRLRRQQRRSLS